MFYVFCFFISFYTWSYGFGAPQDASLIGLSVINGLLLGFISKAIISIFTYSRHQSTE